MFHLAVEPVHESLANHRQLRRTVSEINLKTTEPNMYVKLQAKLIAKDSKYLFNSCATPAYRIYPYKFNYHANLRIGESKGEKEV